MKFIRHHSPRALADAGTAEYVRDVRKHFATMDSRDLAGFAEFLGLQEARVLDACDWAGFHGFTTDNGRIHYYAPSSLPREKLLYLLAHEAGHAVGVPLEGVAEENRADTYALALGEVLIEMGLMSSRHRSCLEDGR